MKHNLTRRPTAFFITAPMPCPYIEGNLERRMVAELSGTGAGSLHDTLSRVGFRRSHGLVYAPVCPGCDACLAVRTVVAEFRPSASHRRVLKANADLTESIKSPRATGEQFELFTEYQESRHNGGDMATMDFYDYQALIEETPVETEIVEYRDARRRLVGACLTDRMSDGLSAVYSYFDPAQSRRSLGTYIILRMIERAVEEGLPYVYLGYWIEGSRKMSYKDRFRPLEYYAGDGWRLLPDRARGDEEG